MLVEKTVIVELGESRPRSIVSVHNAQSSDNNWHTPTTHFAFERLLESKSLCEKRNMLCLFPLSTKTSLIVLLKSYREKSQRNEGKGP